MCLVNQKNDKNDCNDSIWEEEWVDIRCSRRVLHYGSLSILISIV